MNRRGFFTKALVGLAVTPAALKAVTDARPMSMLELINSVPASSGPPDMDELFRAAYALKRRRDAEPPKDYIEVWVPGPDGREVVRRLEQMFRSYHRVCRVTDDGYERMVEKILGDARCI